MAGLSRHLGTVEILVMHLIAILTPVLMESDFSKKPFRAVWNYPDTACRILGIDFQLDKYSIESNSDGFIGDTIALYYSHRAGVWPYVEFGNENEKDVLKNGGWPHKFDLELHLKHLRNVISANQSPGSTGFGVIDMELWRPILRTNYGSFEPYRKKFVEYISKTHPHLNNTKDLIAKANEIWSASAKTLMLNSINTAKKIRPHAHWGYYRYPEKVTTGHNHKLEWLWKAVTAYYPSIYIHNYSMPVEEVEKDVKAAIAEAFRVRALYGKPDNPIMAYVDVQTIPKEGRDKWLRLQLQVPVEMGVDGIILWGSSSNFTPDPPSKCFKIKQYITGTVGPYIADIMKEMSSCSKKLCMKNGRCVRKTYAQNIPHLVTKEVNETLDEMEPAELLVPRMVSVNNDFESDYVCQCYTGWNGKKCSKKTMEKN